MQDKEIIKGEESPTLSVLTTETAPEAGDSVSGLLPCPFCQWPVTGTKINGVGVTYTLVGCDNKECPASDISCFAERWNRRADSALLAAAKAALKWIDNLDESRPTSATCPRCTDGSVPNRLNLGLCSLCQLEDQLNTAVKGTK